MGDRDNGWTPLTGTLPSAEVMGVVGLAALIANIGVALMLYRLPRRRRQHALGVDLLAQRRDRQPRRLLAAAAGVFGTGTGWPDLIVAGVLAALGISGGWQIMRQALGELRGTDSNIGLSDASARQA